jgi:PhnB protein
MATIPGVTPLLTVDEAAAAIEFYRLALSAEEVLRTETPDGRVAHATLRINGGLVYISDSFPQFERGGSPLQLGGSPVTLHIETDHPDIVFGRAVAAGCIPTLPLQDTFWGSRFGQVLDPFGHRWSIGSPPKPISDAEFKSGAQKYWR